MFSVKLKAGFTVIKSGRIPIIRSMTIGAYGQAFLFELVMMLVGMAFGTAGT
jgi:hypothetical protein